jgi:hypothetical protein
MGLHKEDNRKEEGQKLQLSEAMALFCPTYESLEELKQALIANMSDTIERIKREHPCGITQEEYLKWYQNQFGIGLSPYTEEIYASFMDIRLQVQILMIEEATAGAKRAIKRIVQIQQHLLNPGKKQGGVTAAEIEQAREYPLEDLIGTRMFKATGKWRANCHCPLTGHEGEKTPSFYIDKSNHYKCFGCGGRGDSIAFVMQRDGLNFIQAVKSLI